MKIIKDSRAMDKTMERMTREILERHNNYDNIVFIGIRTRGIYLARRLKEKFEAATGIKTQTGELDITLYRDDLSQISEYPVVKATTINFDITDKNIILADDVLYTGRTIRAALSELADFGRAGSIELAVLVDRGHREVPIRADYTGYTLPTSRREVVHVRLLEQDGEDAVLLGEKDDK